MLLLFYFVFIIYEEVLYKLLSTHAFNLSIINALFYYLFIAGILSLITHLCSDKVYKHVLRILTFIVSFWYGASLMVRRVFNITLELSATTMADQFLKGGFYDLLIDVLSKHWYVIILVLLPFVLSIFIAKYYKKKTNRKIILLHSLLIVLSFSLFISSLFVINKEITNELYFKQRNNTQNVDNFGVLPSLFIDLRKELTGFEEEIVIEEEIVEEEKVYDKQILDIDFNSLSNEDRSEENKSLDTYFSYEQATYKNDYTGMFKGKNLIYIMAESFDGFMVNKELTPTLYSMIHSGFYFDNYYSPTNLSTIGGEFSLLTGLLPDLTCLSWKWRESQGYGNYYPYGLGTVFNDLGYSTFAYHNHDYDFQDRNVYLVKQGFNNFLGCGNGIENKGVSCVLKGFPESDDEMIMGTYKDYIDKENFMVYYATVSGHMSWDFSKNKMSIKHKDKVMDLDYSDTVKAYIAANLELEEAMSDLIQILDENGKLADTVIVLAADHHPYGLTQEEMDDLAKRELDQTFEIYENNLIIYNSEVEHTVINKACSTIDVLPTTLNLFGIDYDSRIIIGKDILYDDDGLVMFADGSWLTNKGKYNNNTDEFVGFTNVDPNYIARIKRLAQNRALVSKKIMYYDYYNSLLK